MPLAMKPVLAAMMMCVVGSGALAADDAATVCDNVAGSPLDLDLPAGATGMAFEDLDPSDAAEAVCLKAASEAPSERRFLTHLGRIYAKRGQFTRALEAYRIANGRGSAVAANNLGAMYVSGQAVVANEERATQFIRKAAHRGLPFAMQTMAARARTGRGMTESDAMAFFWYERAYQAGNVEAANDLGVMYQNGFGVREDDVRAVELFAEALRGNPGYAIAAYNLAEAYEIGEGVPFDAGWARGYYAMAFDAGEADAAYDLGRMHANGIGSIADASAAADWYARGADAGSLLATVSLADAYDEGTGVETDAEKARTLYTAALDLDPDDEWRAYIQERLDALPKATE